MRRYLGRGALGAAIFGWLLLLGGLFVGGLDPTPEQYNTLRALMGFASWPNASPCRLGSSRS